MRAHYLNFIYGEWIDFIAHVVWMALIADYNSDLIYAGFEVQHILTSVAQSGIRYVSFFNLTILDFR